MNQNQSFLTQWAAGCRRFREKLSKLCPSLSIPLYFGKHISKISGKAVVFFPIQDTVLNCGLAGIIALKHSSGTVVNAPVEPISQKLDIVFNNRFLACYKDRTNFTARYLGGRDILDGLLKDVRDLKKDQVFFDIYQDDNRIETLEDLGRKLAMMIEEESKVTSDHLGYLDSDEVETVTRFFEDLQDILWILDREVVNNIRKVKNLSPTSTPSFSEIKVFKNINAVLNSIDRLEVRGRDSAGISMIFMIPEADIFMENLKKMNLEEEFQQRMNQDILINKGIRMSEVVDGTGQTLLSVSFTYKIAAEIGSLGDNIRFLRTEIKNDSILQYIAAMPHTYNTVVAHTRWASVGAITEPNCHPVDNITSLISGRQNGIIHVCLNGDIDNYLDLKKDFEAHGGIIPGEITTDTKIIPLVIEKYYKKGYSLEDSFRRAVRDFDGSHAISMHSDLAPGKIFLAQKGSGQAIFVGLADEHFMPVSEVYGFIEETSDYLKLDGERIVEGRNGKTQGQIFVLSQNAEPGYRGVKAMYYDGTPVEITEKDVKHTAITSRDIDRQDFPHYFLKEISESPVSVEKTLFNRWRIREDGHYAVTLDESVVPPSLKKALSEDRIRQVYFVGQGTAGVAAMACANILNYYMDDPHCHFSALKSSELSGFKLRQLDEGCGMKDTLVIAISQSGTTTDTNRTVDMVKERGAHTLAIVNRRDSDLTFKVDGVMYTSSGRDIEMSVASTKAFYSQIVAGAILGLYLAHLKGHRDDEFVTREIRQLLELPRHMRKILSMHRTIGESAKRIAGTKTYWATVGSGPNKASADEIRIKLSELCYKTISSDYVEDKKHIDLSSEPLIIVCAAGARDTVIGDIIKDTAIFRAHKALPVVIANENEHRFDPYAENVFHVPAVAEHLAPIVNTLVGHIWGYYAALSINDGSRFLFDFREDIQKAIEQNAQKGLDVYELILEKSFREKIAKFYTDFRKKTASKELPEILSTGAISDLTLLLKYLTGRLTVADFELDFGIKGTASNMLNTLFECLATSINELARPVDAIKHQAKTVTVGTSRISEKAEGLLFDVLNSHGFKPSQLTNKNVVVLKNLQNVVADVKGFVLYEIAGLDLLGEPTETTEIFVKDKGGTSASIPSRVEADHRLKGTKEIIVRQGNVYIGKGRKDNRSLLIIPLISVSPATPNLIDHLLLLNISFREMIPLETKVKALGGKYDHIRNIVQENNVTWDDRLLETVETEELFGRSAEKIAEFIVTDLQKQP